jgi:outer membrane protein, heavy metal efflux system
MADIRRWMSIALALLLVGGCADPAPESRGVYVAGSSLPSPAVVQTPEPNATLLPQLGENSTLHDYIDYAILNNPGLAAAFDRWQAESHRVPQATALPDPTIGYTHHFKTRGDNERRSIEATQTLPWFGRLDLQGDATMAAAEAQRRAYEAARVRLISNVKTAYYDYYYLGRSIASVKENIQLVKGFESIVSIRYQTSGAAYADVTRAQVELGTLENQLKSLEDLQGPAAAKLNASMSRSTGAALPWPADVEDRQLALDDVELERMLAQNSPDLMAAQAEINRSRKEIDLAQKAYYPDVTFGAEVADWTATDTQDQTSAFSGSVMINLPIWRDKLQAGLDESHARHQAAIADKTDKTNSLGADLKMAAYGYRDGRRRIALYRDVLIPKQMESIKAIERSYQAGSGSFLDLIEAERTLLEFRLSYYRALADQAAGLARVEMLVGREL